MNSEDDVVDKKSKLCSIEEPNWCVKTFGSLLEDPRKDPSTHDVTFKTSDGGSVSAHRVIVAAGSPVFHEMLEGDSSQEEIEISSNITTSINILKLLLTFIYTGKVSFSQGQCADVLTAAHYCGLDVLESYCADYIIDVENCCIIAGVAHKQSYEMVLQNCLSFMFIHATEIIMSPDFPDLLAEVLISFLKSSDVRASEIDLFNATVNWYRDQDNPTPDVATRIFQLIRYPLISKHDLVNNVRPVKEIDSALFTAALEYHSNFEKYSGPPEQITQRKPWFEIVSATPDTIELEKSKDGIVVSRVGDSNGWDGLCAVRVGPQEQDVEFTLCLKTCRSLSHLEFDLKSLPLDALAIDKSTHFEGILDFEKRISGIDARHLKQGELINVTASLSGKWATVMVGSQPLGRQVLQDTPIFLCIFLYSVGDKLVISHV